MCDCNRTSNCAVNCNDTTACLYGYDWSGGRAPCGPCPRGSEKLGATACTSGGPRVGCGVGCGGGQGPCSGCDVHLSHHQCQWCANSRAAQQAYSQANSVRNAALKKGEIIIPTSGSFQFSDMGAWQPYGIPCQLNNPVAGSIAPPGMHACKVAEPNVWSIMPNWIPCSVAINSYYDRAYVNDIYDTTNSKPFCGPGCNGADPAYVSNPYQWPPPVPMSSAVQRDARLMRYTTAAEK